MPSYARNPPSYCSLGTSSPGVLRTTELKFCCICVKSFWKCLIAFCRCLFQMLVSAWHSKTPTVLCGMGGSSHNFASGPSTCNVTKKSGKKRASKHQWTNQQPYKGCVFFQTHKLYVKWNREGMLWYWCGAPTMLRICETVRAAALEFCGGRSNGFTGVSQSAISAWCH